MRYLDLTLAAYVGESVIVRYDPRDMAEIRVFHDHRFLCRAICAELAGETIALRDIMRARNRRRRDLRQTLQERARMVDVLLEARRGDTHTDDPTQTHDLTISQRSPLNPRALYGSSDTSMNNVPSDFVVTNEHRRFAEFCDACRQYRYIGLCYGAPGVGKTLSAKHYTNSVRLETPEASHLGAEAKWAVGTVSTTVFYTPEVVNAPRRIEQDIRTKRHQLRMLAIEVWLQDQQVQYQARKQAEALLPPKRVESGPRQNGKVVQIYESAAAPRPPCGATYARQRETMPDPTDLIIIDEADRMKTASLEQVRDIFD